MLGVVQRAGRQRLIDRLQNMGNAGCRAAGRLYRAGCEVFARFAGSDFPKLVVRWTAACHWEDRSDRLLLAFSRTERASGLSTEWRLPAGTVRPLESAGIAGWGRNVNAFVGRPCER